MTTPNVISRRVLSCLLAAAVCAFAGSDDPEPAPHFRAKTLTGENFNNASVKGKVVLFEFWTTWCEYCRQEQALVDEINQEFAGKGLIVLAVDVGEGKKKVARYLAENPRSGRIVLTEDTNLASMYAALPAGERALRNLLRRAGLRGD